MSLRTFAIGAALVASACATPASEATGSVELRGYPLSCAAVKPAFDPVRFNKLSAKAKLIHDWSARYPRRLAEAGIYGTTELVVEVTDTGAVRCIYVARSSGYEELDDLALNAVTASGGVNGTRMFVFHDEPGLPEVTSTVLALTPAASAFPSIDAPLVDASGVVLVSAQGRIFAFQTALRGLAPVAYPRGPVLGCNDSRGEQATN